MNTKFLALYYGNHINWEKRVEQLVPKLKGASYAVRSVLHVGSADSPTFILLIFTL
jgi:hypothetical protein